MCPDTNPARAAQWGRLAALSALMAVSVMLSACTGNSNGDTPKTAPPDDRSSYSFFADGPETIVLEHDGYVAGSQVCQQVDWSSLDQLRPLAPMRIGGGYSADDRKVAVASCTRQFSPEATVDSTTIDHVQLQLTLGSSTDWADKNCRLVGTPRSLAAGSEWDFLATDVDADKGSIMVFLQKGPFCVAAAFWIGTSLWTTLPDPEAKLTSIGLTLAENARQLSLSANHPR